MTLALSEPDATKPDTIDESGAGNASTVTATLNGVSSAAVTLTVSASAVAPAVARDFTRTGTTLTIAAGDTASTGTVTVTAVDDDVYAPDKSVTVSATSAGGNGVANPSDATLTIAEDDDAPRVTLVLSRDRIREDAAAPADERKTAVTATLSHPASGATAITVTATADTNAAAADFTLSSATTLTIAAGQTASTGTVTITAANDAIDSVVDSAVAGKKVVVAGGASGGLADPADVDLLIVEDDAAALVLDPAIPSDPRQPWFVVDEGDGTTFTVKLNSEPTANVTVAVASTDTAQGTVSPLSLTFTATTWNVAQTVTLTGVTDDVVDPDANYRLTLDPDGETTDAYDVAGHGRRAGGYHERRLGGGWTCPPAR